MNENLRRSAFLNSITSIIDYVAKMGVGFILNPIMVGVLGPIYFGAWQVISQLNSYMATADIRAATSLKFILSRDRSVKNKLELKQAVSAALYSNLVFIPFYLLLGTFIVWFAPILAGIELPYFYTVRVASAFLVFSFIVTQFFFLFESTLHGMNLSYKRIGIRAIIIILGGIATAAVLYLDYGIIGMAIVQVIIASVIGLSFWWIVKKYIPWFEFVKVHKKKVISFIKLSVWYMLLKLSDLLSQSIDMILLGFLAGPKYVAVYAISKYFMMATSGIVRTVSSSALIGISKFIGEKKHKKLIEARSQLVSIQWILIIIGGSLVCLYNESFVKVWTEDNFFVGQIETLFIVLIALVTVICQVDSGIINATLNVKKKIGLTLISALISIGLSFILVPELNTLGMLISILIGILFLSFSNTFLVMKITTYKDVFKDLYLSRIALVGIIIIVTSSGFSKYIHINSWFTLFYSVLVAVIILSMLTWFIGMNSKQRTLIYNTIQKIKNK